MLRPPPPAPLRTIRPAAGQLQNISTRTACSSSPPWSPPASGRGCIHSRQSESSSKAGLCAYVCYVHESGADFSFWWIRLFVLIYPDPKPEKSSLTGTVTYLFRSRIRMNYVYGSGTEDIILIRPNPVPQVDRVRQIISNWPTKLSQLLFIIIMKMCKYRYLSSKYGNCSKINLDNFTRRMRLYFDVIESYLSVSPPPIPSSETWS